MIQFCLVMMAFNGAFLVLGPVVARSHLGGPAAWGAISASDALGLVAGGLVSLRYIPRRPMLFVVLTGGSIAISPLALALVLPLPVICLSAFAVGLLCEVMMVQWTVQMATRIPSDKLARVSSYDAMGSLAAMPLGALAAGPLAAGIGVSATQFAAAGVIVVSSALTLIPRDIRTIRSGAVAHGDVTDGFVLDDGSPPLSPVPKRERTSAEHGPDRERGPRLGHPGDGKDLVEQQQLVAGQVRHGRLDEEVIRAGDQVAGDDGGDGEERLLDHR